MCGPNAAVAGTPMLPAGRHRPLALELREISINANAGYSKLLNSDVTHRKCRSQSSARIGVAVLNRDMSTCPVVFTAMLAAAPDYCKWGACKWSRPFVLRVVHRDKVYAESLYDVDLSGLEGNLT